jgi:integrase/recombinase XerD
MRDGGERGRKSQNRRFLFKCARWSIKGTQASPKGLRHGFGVAAVQARIPLNLVQRWLGHAQLSTTAIYAEAIGQEEQEIAARMWT